MSYQRRRTDQDAILDNLIWLQGTRSDRLGLAEPPELPPTTGRVEHNPGDDGSAPCNVETVAAPHSRARTDPGSAPSADPYQGSRPPRRG